MHTPCLNFIWPPANRKRYASAFGKGEAAALRNKYFRVVLAWFYIHHADMSHNTVAYDSHAVS